MRYLVIAVLALAASFASQVSHADTYSSRQYYGGWKQHPVKKYYYRPYYYKPTKSYYGYKHHYVTYHPKYSKHYYYYNPYQKKYWGRVPTHCDGKPQYEILKDEDRKPEIPEIPEKAFTKMDKMPPIPDSKGEDVVPMDLPPDDGPPGVTD